MHYRIYIYASGSNASILELHSATNLNGSEIKALKVQSNTGLPDRQPEERWMWRTPYQECSTKFPEDQLANYLHQNPNILEQIRARRSELQEVVGMIVCDIDENEAPHGYSISCELMKLLISAGASLEIDVCTHIT